MIRYLKYIIEFGFPRTVLYCNGGLGDDLMLTYVALAYQKKYRTKANVITSRPVLFDHHPSVDQLFTIGQFGEISLYLNFINKIFRTNYKIIHCTYKEQPLALYPSKLMHQHMYDGMLETIGAERITDMELKPYLFFNTTSINYDFKESYILIHSSSLSAPYAAKVKEWNMFENQFQIFTAKYGKEINSKYGKLVQIGALNDPKLENCLDLRGETNLNQLIALVANSKLFIGLEGGIMHLARAFNIPQIIIFGGRTMPQETGYFEPNIINLYSEVECSPCWNKNDCNFKQKCMDNITPEIVLNSITDLI